MNVLLYNIFLLLYKAAIHTSSLFDSKAKRWVSGRKKIFSRLQQVIPQDQKIVWMHCASLGEFEQGRPLLEKLRQQYPEHRYLLTFFSPSGYDAAKDYTGVDWVFYLPMDGPNNARRFLEIVKPSLVLFVKYEFWFYYLKKIKYRNIPVLLVSGFLKDDRSLLKIYDRMLGKMLTRFDHLFLQSTRSATVAARHGLSQISTVSGDTRFDRVIEIAKEASPLPLIENFLGSQKALIAGSTWSEDEDVLKKVFGFLQANKIRLIIAPHEINKKHIEQLKEQFIDAVLYSELVTQKETHTPVLIIDNIGLLSKLYRYSWCSYVGGGMSKGGVHNVLEAAVYGKPVFFGPEYKRYPEATGLVEVKGAFAVADHNEFTGILQQLIKEPVMFTNAGNSAAEYVQQNGGAVKLIVDHIQENRLLTN